MEQPPAQPAEGERTLILASRVEDTPVYNRDGERIGNIADLSIDRVSGQVIYAIMSFGGFLGIGKQYHPLPWSMLDYDLEQGGYIVSLDKEALSNAPVYAAEELSRFGGDSHAVDQVQLYEYYGRYGMPAPFF